MKRIATAAPDPPPCPSPSPAGSTPMGGEVCSDIALPWHDEGLYQNEAIEDAAEEVYSNA